MNDTQPKTKKFNAQAIDKFLSKNPTVNLKTFSFLNKKKVDALQWGKTPQEDLLPHLKALQRLLHLTSNQTIAQALYKAGIHSCFQIARIPKKTFIDRYQTAFGGNATHAKRFWQRAQSRVSQLALHHIALHSHRGAYYRTLRHSNLDLHTKTNKL